MAAIDIGLKIADPDEGKSAGWTYIVKANPANLSGKITTLDLQCYNDVTGLKVVIFEKVGTNDFTTRSIAVVGDLASGIHTGVAVDLDVEAGDYIGFYTAAGALYGKSNHGGGEWYLVGDYTDVDDQTFSTWTSSTYLWGDGKEPGAGGSRVAIIG